MRQGARRRARWTPNRSRRTARRSVGRLSLHAVQPVPPWRRAPATPTRSLRRGTSGLAMTARRRERRKRAGVRRGRRGLRATCPCRSPPDADPRGTARREASVSALGPLTLRHTSTGVNLSGGNGGGVPQQALGAIWCAEAPGCRAPGVWAPQRLSGRRPRDVVRRPEQCGTRLRLVDALTRAGPSTGAPTRRRPGRTGGARVLGQQSLWATQHRDATRRLRWRGPGGWVVDPPVALTMPGGGAAGARAGHDVVVAISGDPRMCSGRPPSCGGNGRGCRRLGPLPAGTTATLRSVRPCMAGAGTVTEEGPWQVAGRLAR